MPGSWLAIDPGFTTCGIKTDATGWCWGLNEPGRVGDATTINRSRPVQLPGLWSSFDVSVYGASCGVQQDGTGWCWGSNVDGQVGDGTTIDRLTPVQLPGSWQSVDASFYTTCGVQTDATGWCWGFNGSGAVGDGTTALFRLEPVRLPGRWRTIENPNGSTVCGIRLDDTGWCWGDNRHGEVGNGRLLPVRSPEQLPGTWSAIDPDGLQTADERSSCGLRLDATGWCWGYNGPGTVGIGTQTDAEKSPRRVTVPPLLPAR